MRSITTFDLQYAHRFYGFQGEAQYLHGHTGVLTIEVEDSVNEGVNMVYPCNEIQKVAWDVPAADIQPDHYLGRCYLCYGQFHYCRRADCLPDDGRQNDCSCYASGQYVAVFPADSRFHGALGRYYE